MRVICRQNAVPVHPNDGVAFSLFEQPRRPGVGRVAAAMPQHLRRLGVYPSSRAWDLLAVALSVAAADQGCLRKNSPDGWTREIQLDVSVTDPGFWDTKREALEAAVRFLTSDVWHLSFVAGGVAPPRRIRYTRRRPVGDCVCLLSGGVDSLVGAIDAVASGLRPVLVSQVAQGDSDRQRSSQSQLEGICRTFSSDTQSNPQARLSGHKGPGRSYSLLMGCLQPPRLTSIEVGNWWTYSFLRMAS